MPKLDRLIIAMFLLGTFLTASQDARADGLTCAAGAECGFLDSGGTFTSISVPGAGSTSASGINNGGDIVGWFSPGSQNVTEGFFYNGTTYTAINYPGASFTEALGVNNLGEIVGEYNTAAGQFGFVDNGGTFTSIGIAGASSTVTTGINNVGQIVGYSCNSTGCTGLFDSGGTITSIKDPGANDTYAYGINDNGKIVGSVNQGGSGVNGFVDQAGSFTITSLCPHTCTTYLTGVNDAGEIVGTASGAQQQGAVSEGGIFSEFSVPNTDGSTYQYTDASGINNEGQIVGSYRQPVPEPGTLALLATSLIILAGIGYRRRWLLNI